MRTHAVSPQAYQWRRVSERRHRPALRHAGQPSASHCSTSSRRQRINDASLTGRGIWPESAIRRTVRVDTDSIAATASTVSSSGEVSVMSHLAVLRDGDSDDHSGDLGQPEAY
ncbi:MAG: hypothetical protein O3B86_16210 [Planctomycetota bacterium]|nr:hypothetical protein [Planctomycetota bacterium]